MSSATNESQAVATRPAIAAVLDALRPLVASIDPAAVCLSAAQLCVPALCDSVSLELAVPDAPAYRISWPQADLESAAWPDPEPVARELHSVGSHRLTSNTVYTPIRPAIGDTGPDYLGTLAMRFELLRPGPLEVLLGQLVVERITSAIHQERLRQEVAAETERSYHLQQALLRNREIGAALGILMASQKCTNEQAFTQLRNVSQNTHRKLHEIALDVIDTGMLDVPADAAGE